MWLLTDILLKTMFINYCRLLISGSNACSKNLNVCLQDAVRPWGSRP